MHPGPQPSTGNASAAAPPPPPPPAPPPPLPPPPPHPPTPLASNRLFSVQNISFWIKHPTTRVADVGANASKEEVARGVSLTRPIVFLHGVGWGLVRLYPAQLPMYMLVCVAFTEVCYNNVMCVPHAWCVYVGNLFPCSHLCAGFSIAYRAHLSRVLGSQLGPFSDPSF